MRARARADQPLRIIQCGGEEFVLYEFRPVRLGGEAEAALYADRGLLEFEPEAEATDESPLVLMGLDPSEYSIADLADVLESLAPYSYDVLAEMLQTETANKNRKGAIEAIEAAIVAQQDGEAAG